MKQLSNIETGAHGITSSPNTALELIGSAAALDKKIYSR